MKVLFMGRKTSAAQALAWTVAQGFEVVGVVTDEFAPPGETIFIRDERSSSVSTPQKTW